MLQTPGCHKSGRSPVALRAYLFAGGAGAGRGIDPLAQRGPGDHERRVKLAVGRDLLGRYPGQLARLPGVGATATRTRGRCPLERGGTRTT